MSQTNQLSSQCRNRYGLIELLYIRFQLIGSMPNWMAKLDRQPNYNSIRCVLFAQINKKKKRCYSSGVRATDIDGHGLFISSIFIKFGNGWWKNVITLELVVKIKTYSHSWRWMNPIIEQWPIVDFSAGLVMIVDNRVRWQWITTIPVIFRLNIIHCTMSMMNCHKWLNGTILAQYH